MSKAKEVLRNFYLLKIKKLFFKKTATNIFDQKKIFDQKLVYSFSKSRIPNLGQLKYLKKFLSSRELWILRISFAILFASIFFVSSRFYLSHRQSVPAKGGEYVEALRGGPKYVNSLYSALSDVDSDISSLVYSSLFKRDKNGRLEKDLAADYKISEDGKEYSFKIRQGVKWHDGSLLTVDDIIFTFNLIKNKQYQSPLRQAFAGVELEKVDDENIKFIIAEPYAPFLELLTFGIMPENLWSRVSPASVVLAELNLKPIGSGPYKFKSLSKNEIGQVDLYNLVANDDYYGQAPKISNFSFKFFPNFEEEIKALSKGEVDGISYLPKNFEKDLVAKDSLSVRELNLSQLTAIFFNKRSNSGLEDKKVRQALALAVNKNKIASDIFGGGVRIIDGSILPDNFAFNPAAKRYEYSKEAAEKLLDEAGWKREEITAGQIAELEKEKEKLKGEKKREAENIIKVGEGKRRRKTNEFLTVKLTVIETEENIKAAEAVRGFWEDIGVKTTIEPIAPGTYSQNEISAIKSLNYEALFYDQIVGADPDIYAFWHSSQAGESGLNLSNYDNKEVDRLLEEGRIISEPEARKNKYWKIQEIINEESPAIFLYSPIYNYVQSKKIKGFSVESILVPSDRFSDINSWYIKTKNKLVWQ